MTSHGDWPVARMTIHHGVLRSTLPWRILTDVSTGYAARHSGMSSHRARRHIAYGVIGRDPFVKVQSQSSPY